jgi:Transposase DDE domain
VDPEKKYPFLVELLSPFYKRHRKTLALMIAAIAVTGQARSFAIATTLARWLGTRLDSAVNRFYRLLRNVRVDDLLLASQWARQLVRRPDRLLLVAIDWTEWHHDLRLLVAAVVTGKRAIPLFARGFEKRVRLRSQNARENTFLRLLVDILGAAEARAILLFDRGFRRASLLRLLLQLQVGFVVRLMDDVLVEIAPGRRVALKDLLLIPGQVLDLGFVPLRSDGFVTVRIVGYWAPGAAEPWWLATDQRTPARHILQLYDRRMTVEEQFRDLKGRRFGVKLFWTQFRDPEALARFLTLLAIALAVWIAAGRVAAWHNPSLRMVSKRKGPRQSFVTIGLRLVALDLPTGFCDFWLAALLAEPELRRVGRFRGGGK